MSGHTAAAPARLAILISGRGSNMLAIARACADGRLDARVVGVLSDRPDAPGLDAAAALGLPCAVVERAAFADRAAFDRALGERLDAWRPDRVLLAGFMRVLGPTLTGAWQDRMLNIHPSLLPKYPGLDTHARALAAGRDRARRERAPRHGRARRRPGHRPGARADPP